MGNIYNKCYKRQDIPMNPKLQNKWGQINNPRHAWYQCLCGKKQRKQEDA